jgi:hypothetical protein
LATSREGTTATPSVSGCTRLEGLAASCHGGETRRLATGREGTTATPSVSGCTRLEGLAASCHGGETPAVGYRPRGNHGDTIGVRLYAAPGARSYWLRR